MRWNLRLVEIELHSFCNRKCSWCPNSKYKRDFYKEMDKDIFLKILSDLKKLNYSHYISFSRYNEPFANKKLLMKRISQVKKALPNAKIVCNTNGDFPRGDIDIDELTVMDYDRKSRPMKGDKLRVMQLNEVTLNNRGGTLRNIKAVPRKTPCFEPKHFVGIDYTGDVVPCCNVRGDVPDHKEYVLGNIKDDGLIDILNGEKATRFRTAVANMRLPKICRFCNKNGGRYTKEEGGINNVP